MVVSPGTPIASVTLELPNNPASAVRARRAIDELDSDAHPETLARARLLVTEVVAAGITDTSSATLTLTLSAAPGEVRAELSTPVTKPPRPSGWGLFLMNRFADRWGVERPGRVWFEVVDRRERERGVALGAPPVPDPEE